MDLNKRIALIATGSLLSVGGLYAVSTAANAAGHVAPAVPAASSLSPGTATMDETEAVETGAASDGPDQGPDVNATEAGHQDAPGADDGAEGAEVSEANEGPEVSSK